MGRAGGVPLDNPPAHPTMPTALNPTFLVAALVGIAAIAVGLAMSRGQANGSFNGYKAPIIAFEFAQTRDDVERIRADFETQTGKPFAVEMDRLNWLDMLFLALYGAFLALFSAAFGQHHHQPWLGYLGAVLAFGAAWCDFLENQQMLAITARLESGDYQPFLQNLNLFTRLKWGLIPVLMALLLPFLWQGGWASKGLGAVSLLSIVFAALALLPARPAPAAVERFTASVFLLFLLVLVYTAMLAAWGNARPRWL